MAANKNGKAEPSTLMNAPGGNAVNPRLFATRQGHHWLVWENYHDTKFSIYGSRLESGTWSVPVQLTPGSEVCFDPALAEGKDGNIYLVYGKADGLHQNIEMRIFKETSLKLKNVVPLAIGGELKERVNLNTKPALSFDNQDRLWISWENNKNSSRLDDSDVYTGDRSCSMVCYTDGKLMEGTTGKWLFEGYNDHYPTFVSDTKRNLYAFTRCGGDFKGKPKWQYRFSSLGRDGWSRPQTIMATDQKGQTARPSVTFLEENVFLLTWKLEKFSAVEGNDRITKSKINITHFSLEDSGGDAIDIALKPASVEGYHPCKVTSKFSGRYREESRRMTYRGDEYSLISGCLHEHTELYYCWPAGTDGDLHSNYRFGIYSEGYDFVAIPHHPADSSHQVSWEERDEEIEPIVELFQCRGNNEYPGCPREKNLDRHSTTHLKEVFVDYALREKRHKLRFVASGDHNGMGVGLASLWVKEPGRKGIMEALRARRCFATTGDKIFVDMKINGSMMGETTSLNGTPGIEIRTKTAEVLEKVELLRNSRVIKTWNAPDEEKEFSVSYADEAFNAEKEVLYYYVRVTQKDNEIAWSSPIWIEV